MSKRNTDEILCSVMEDIILWWDSDSPERRLSADEAHDLGGYIATARILLMQKKRIKNHK